MNANSPVIAIEGIDGCGKSTVAALLAKRLRDAGRDVAAYDFPVYDEPCFGPLIARFLRGEFGAMPLAEPWFVGFLFAANRAEVARRLRADVAAGRIVVCDRFTYSNIAFQSAKLTESDDVAGFADWLMHLELSTLGTPAPDVSIWLRVPPDQRPAPHVDRGQRKYLNGAVDVHEANTALQARVHQVYERLAASRPDLEIVDCVRGRELLPPNDICDLVIERLEFRGMLSSVNAVNVPR